MFITFLTVYRLAQNMIRKSLVTETYFNEATYSTITSTIVVTHEKLA